MTEVNTDSSNFIHEIIDEDLASKKHEQIITRFPPEPNGYLHIGHAKSICLNFGTAIKYGGKCHLRFDDTNPTKEDVEYVDSIQEDVKWLGFDWKENLYFASSYFEKIYECAIELIKAGKAYVCDLSPEETREFRGTPMEHGKNSPYRNRTVEENLDLFEKMKNGEFDEGHCVLRAKIDMTSPNLNMRDPILYRIAKAHHHRTGDKWCIYPMYDFTHPISDALENITHSICTLEFEDHRPLYDWTVENVSVPSRPHQYEFARLNLTYTVMSKRKLLKLVQENHVNGWDDPRMPTLAGMRRRGYTPDAIRNFCDRIGVAKTNSTVDKALLDFCLREDLNKKSTRVMAILDPVKLIITNYQGEEEVVMADNNPEDPDAGQRKVPFSGELYIERADFREDAPRKFFRLAPGKEVRLKHAYYVTCTDFVKDEDGNLTEIHCAYDPDVQCGVSDDGRKVKGTLHWVSAKHAVDATVRQYDSLFNVENPGVDKDFLEEINSDSLVELKTCKLEPSLKDASLGINYQFLRNGYYVLDKDSTSDDLIFNRTVGLRDTWAKLQQKMNK